MTEEEKYVELSKGKRFASNLTAAVGLFLCGAVLLVFGIGGESWGISVVLLVAPVILLAIGLIFLVSSLIQVNTVTLYISVLFLVSSLVSFLANLTDITYATLWPLYVAAPAVASLFTMFMSGEYRFHIRMICVFAVPALLFALFACGIWSVGVLIPSLIMYAGLLALYVALSINGASEE